jgi:type II secretory pathway component PulF
MLALGDFMGHWWWAILGLMFGAFVGSRLSLRTEKGAFLRDRILLASPVLGGFVHKIALSRFAKTFSLIIASGTDLLKVLELMQDVVSNRVMAKELVTIRKRVASGENLSTSFAEAKTFPILIRRLITVGEMTGSLDSSLMRGSEYLDREIPRDLKRAFTIFEAVIIAILGAMVCVASLSLLMPIMSIRADM